MVKAHKKIASCSKSSSQKGFTLIEVALTVVVGGMLLAFFGDSLMNSINESKIKTTQQRMTEVSDALRRYASYSSHLPCPARRNVLPTDANFGVALASCAPGAPVGGTVTAGGVRNGTVPTRTLNLPDEYAYDAWGTRFIYAATEAMTSSARYDTEAACSTAASGFGGPCITVDANPIRAAFAIVSVGPDRQGSVGSGTTGLPCASGAGQADIENCNDDAAFTDALQSTAQDTNYYDDFIVYQSLQADVDGIPEGAVVPFRLSTCPKGWDEYDEMEGHFAVGRGTYVHTAPSGATGAYSKSYSAGNTGGSATRLDTPPGALTGVSEYKNFPPYIVYTYCVKS